MNTNDREQDVTLGVRRVVAPDARLTQRSLAARAGIGLGRANEPLLLCARKAYIEIPQAPASRCACHPTPKGFTSMHRHAVRYVSAPVVRYRSTRQVEDSARLAGVTAQRVGRLSAAREGLGDDLFFPQTDDAYGGTAAGRLERAMETGADG